MLNIDFNEIIKNGIIVILAVVVVLIPTTSWFGDKFPEKTIQRLVITILFPFIFFGIVVIGGIYLQRLLGL